MKETHPPSIAEKILVTIFPFLAGIMNISTGELRTLNMEDPNRASKIANAQSVVDKSSRQAEKSKYS